jgi:ElaA protein
MKAFAKTFDELTNTELYEIMRLRQDVFVVEQTCPYFDLDGVDYKSTHVFIEDGGKIVAYLRLFPRDGEEGIIRIGRVVTRERNKGYGAAILSEGLRVARERFLPRGFYLEAQTYAVGYYAREGFEVASDVFSEDGIPHVEMRKYE